MIHQWFQITDHCFLHTHVLSWVIQKAQSKKGLINLTVKKVSKCGPVISPYFKFCLNSLIIIQEYPLKRTNQPFFFFNEIQGLFAYGF